MPRLNMHSHGVLVQPKKVKSNSLRLGWLCTDLIESLYDGDDISYDDDDRNKAQSEHICLMHIPGNSHLETLSTLVQFV